MRMRHGVYVWRVYITLPKPSPRHVLSPGLVSVLAGTIFVTKTGVPRSNTGLDRVQRGGVPDYESIVPPLSTSVLRLVLSLFHPSAKTGNWYVLVNVCMHVRCTSVVRGKLS